MTFEEWYEGLPSMSMTEPVFAKFVWDNAIRLSGNEISRVAFVRGAKWWQAHASGCTAFPSEVDAIDAEALREYPGGGDHFADASKMVLPANT